MSVCRGAYCGTCTCTYGGGARTRAYCAHLSIYRARTHELDAYWARTRAIDAYTTCTRGIDAYRTPARPRTAVRALPASPRPGAVCPR